MKPSKKVVKLLLIPSVLLILGLLLINECSSGGGMGASYRSCDCEGIEWVQYDRTAADGPRKTYCIGIIRAKECFQFISGPAVECNSGSLVTLFTGKQVYVAGEDINIIIENNLNSPLRYYGFCSLHLCQYLRDEWFCEMKDCDSPVIVLESGSSTEIMTQANYLVETGLKYRFEYQTISEDTLYTIFSNEFTIQQE